MTEKRFKLRLSKLGNGMITDTQKREDLYFDKEFLDATLPKTNEWLNDLADKNEQLKSEIAKLSYANEDLLTEKRNWFVLSNEYGELYDKHEKKKEHQRVLENKIHRMRKSIHKLEWLAHHRNAELLRENKQLKQFKDMVFKRINDRIAFRSHKPYSTPIGQAMSVNFDEDMDRLARLSELQQLKEELKGDVE